jgi:hypothetical protein
MLNSLQSIPFLIRTYQHNIMRRVGFYVGEAVRGESVKEQTEVDQIHREGRRTWLKKLSGSPIIVEKCMRGREYGH